MRAPRDMGCPAPPPPRIRGSSRRPAIYHRRDNRRDRAGVNGRVGVEAAQWRFLPSGEVFGRGVGVTLGFVVGRGRTGGIR
jgi:hypothetical protein